MKLEQLLEQIEASESGPQVAALFDFDGTIIAGYSATVFLRDELTRGMLSAGELLHMTQALASFGMGNMGFSALMAVHAQYMQGRSEKEHVEHSEQLFNKAIARLIYPEARALIEAHQAKGHSVAIISSATPYQVEPAAQDLGINDVFCTRLEVKRGKFTGKVIKPTVFGDGKVEAAAVFAARTGADLDHSFFYSDSSDDIQLLERVGRPVVLNGRKDLRNIARDKGWSASDFSSRGNVSVGRFIRSVAATTSIVTSFAAGLPIYALTGSKRDSINFSLSLFADTASALIGLDLDVKGEEHLWSHRPAVFMFNHQSKVDVAVMASLVRRDVVGVGKKEIRKMPLIGTVMEMAGTTLIDRSNSQAAIESMRPLIRAMQEEGKSLVISPEGTRTPTRKLAPFKKGPFHIAIQAGVPVVPVVIYNAGDIAPKGDFVFRRGTVKVRILPPIDTRHWRTETIEQHVAEVRGQFLEALGQTPLSGQKNAAKTSAKTQTKTRIKSKAKTKTKASTTAGTTAKSPGNKAGSVAARTKKKVTARKTPASKTKSSGPARAPARANSSSSRTVKAPTSSGRRPSARKVKPKLSPER